MPAVSTLKDLSNSAFWESLLTSTASVGVSGTGASTVLTCSVPNGSEQKAWRILKAALDFRGDSMFVRLTTPGADASARRLTGLILYIDANNWIGFLTKGSGSVWYKWEVVAGTPNEVSFGLSYDPTDHAWIRIRGDADGTKLYFDTAPDSTGTPGSWTQRNAWTIPIAINAVKAATGLWEFDPANETVAASITDLNGGGSDSSAPTADFDATVSRRTVTLTDNSVEGSSPITGRSVTWGKGSAEEVTNSSLSHTFTGRGEFDIEATVTDGTLTSDPWTDTITTTTGIRHRVVPNGGRSEVSNIVNRPDA